MKRFIYVLLILILVIPAGAALASDITNATYRGVVQATNTSTIASNVAVPFTANISSWITSGLLNATATNIVAKDDNGNDIAIMPGYSSNPSILFYDSIPASSDRDVTLYLGDVSGGKLAYFPGSTGMAVTDNAILEPSANFTIGLTDTFINTSVSDYITHKLGALKLASGSNNITATVYNASSTITQTDTTGGTQPANNGGQLRVAQYYPSFPAGEMPSITIYLAKNGSPTGLAYLRLRRAGDDAIIGTWGSIDVSTLSTSPAAKVFNTTSVVNPIAQNVYISIEFNGGSVGNSILAYYSSGDVISGSIYAYTTSWTPVAGDMAFVVTYYPIALTLSSAVATGEHDISLVANSTNLTLTVDGSIVANSALGGASVPNTANNWQIGSSATTYITAANITVGGSLKGSWAWMYGATFTDLSGNGRTATPTFRTTSSDADVSAELTTFEPINTATVDTVTASSWPSMVTAVPDQPSNMYSENTSPGIFFAPLVETFWPYSGLPNSFFWYVFAFTFIVLPGMLVFRFFATQGYSGLLIKVIVMMAFMIFWAVPGPNIYGGFVPIYFGMWCFGILVLSKSYGW